MPKRKRSRLSSKKKLNHKKLNKVKQTVPEKSDAAPVRDITERKQELRKLSLSQLNEMYMELEVLIREFSEIRISELAHRDELEYEKELKNKFISLLLTVQNKRRQYHVEKKRSDKASDGIWAPSNGLDPKYLTTVIPYHLDSGPPNNKSLQVFIKILKALNGDSPTVPTLITDYILKCKLHYSII